jgi:ABC-type antimicrobial peptide transport system permease subunit
MRPASTPNGTAEQCEVVGVAQQVKGRPDEAHDLLQIYVPLAQTPVDDVYLLVAPENPRAPGLGSSVRAAIARVDTAQLVSVRDVMTLDDVLWDATARHRFRALLVGGCAALALLVSMVGVSGLLAYSVQRRVREIGIRRALGAATRDVVTIAIGRSIRVLAAGAMVGLILSTVAGRLLTSMLFGIEPWDPLTFAAVVMVVIVTAILAAAAPARRAVRIDPAIALRAE